ncbi:protein of unknown function DUF29 [Candidatus Magnetoovum chiemensis]|nr:protein of unknown function DUF29 [Candidatus Magnetoovum chiemensis]
MSRVVMNANNILADKSLYEADFYKWTLRNAELLRQGKLNEADIENIAEEIESLGRSDKRKLGSRLLVLITHLLKWQYQREKRSHSWITTINTQRAEIERLFEDSPSLMHGVETVIDKEFIRARRNFEKETGVNKDRLPKMCAYTFEQLINSDFWPE